MTDKDLLLKIKHRISKHTGNGNALNSYATLKEINNLGDEIMELVKQRDASVDRFEVIDHRECIWCRGRKTANYLQKDGSYKEQPCDKCDGSGMLNGGGRVFSAHSNPELFTVGIELSYQDDGKTLKVFVNDRGKAS